MNGFRMRLHGAADPSHCSGGSTTPSPQSDASDVVVVFRTGQLEVVVLVDVEVVVGQGRLSGWRRQRRTAVVLPPVRLLPDTTRFAPTGTTILCVEQVNSQKTGTTNVQTPSHAWSVSQEQKGG